MQKVKSVLGVLIAIACYTFVFIAILVSMFIDYLFIKFFLNPMPEYYESFNSKHVCNYDHKKCKNNKKTLRK